MYTNHKIHINICSDLDPNGSLNLTNEPITNKNLMSKLLLLYHV